MPAVGLLAPAALISRYRPRSLRWRTSWKASEVDWTVRISSFSRKSQSARLVSAKAGAAAPAADKVDQTVDTAEFLLRLDGPFPRGSGIEKVHRVTGDGRPAVRVTRGVDRFHQPLGVGVGRDHGRSRLREPEQVARPAYPAAPATATTAPSSTPLSAPPVPFIATASSEPALTRLPARRPPQ